MNIEIAIQFLFQSPLLFQFIMCLIDIIKNGGTYDLKGGNNDF